MAKLAIPTLHMNGTSRDGLVEPIIKVLDAIDRLQKLLQEVHPNGRDYYVQDPGAMQVAVAQHRRRCEKLDQLRKEWEAIALAVDERRITSDVEAAD
jgi:hypothetical protein